MAMTKISYAVLSLHTAQVNWNVCILMLLYDLTGSFILYEHKGNVKRYQTEGFHLKCTAASHIFFSFSSIKLASVGHFNPWRTLNCHLEDIIWPYQRVGHTFIYIYLIVKELQTIEIYQFHNLAVTLTLHQGHSFYVSIKTMSTTM